MKHRGIENIGGVSGRLMGVAGAMLLASCSDPSGEAGSKDGPTVPLFDGISLQGWTQVRDDGVAGGDNVWNVVDGVLVSSTESSGYIYSDSSYQDFELVLDWRWASPEDVAGDGGVLLRITGEPLKLMPKCVEAQISAGALGDLQAYRGAKLEGESDRTVQMSGGEELGDFIGVQKTGDLEKAHGDWNRYEIIVNGGNIEVKVNGEVVNNATGLDVVPGRIGLQSAGGSIEIDYLQVTPL